MFSVTRKVNFRLSTSQCAVVDTPQCEWEFYNRLHTEPEKAVIGILPYIDATKSRNIDLLAAVVQHGTDAHINLLSKIIPLRTLIKLPVRLFRKMLGVCGPTHNGSGFSASIKGARPASITDALVLIYKLSIADEIDFVRSIYETMQVQMKGDLPLFCDEPGATVGDTLELFDEIVMALHYISVCEATGKMTETMALVANVYREQLEYTIANSGSVLGKLLAAYTSAYLKPNVRMLLFGYVNVKSIMATLLYNRFSSGTRNSDAGRRDIAQIMGEIFLNLARAWGCGMCDGTAVSYLSRLTKREMTEMVKYIIGRSNPLAEDAIDTMLKHAENLLDDTQPFLALVAFKMGSKRSAEFILKRLVMSYELMARPMGSQTMTRADLAFHVHMVNFIMVNASKPIPFATKDSVKPNNDDLKPKLFLAQLMDELAAKNGADSDTESDGDGSCVPPSMEVDATPVLNEAENVNVYAVLYLFLLYTQDKDDFIASAEVVAADGKMDLGAMQGTFAAITANVRKMAIDLFATHGSVMTSETKLGYFCILDLGKDSPVVDRLADMVFQDIKRGQSEVTFLPVCMMNPAFLAREMLFLIQFSLLPKDAWKSIDQDGLIGLYGVGRVRAVAEAALLSASNLRLFGSTEKDIESFTREFITPLLHKCLLKGAPRMGATRPPLTPAP